MQPRHALEQMKQQLQNQTPDQRRQSLLGDFPAAALKRTAEVEAPELAKRLKSGFYATLMVSLSQKELQEKRGRRPGHQHASEWLSRRELETLKEVVDLPVTAARWHIAPRKRFQKPPVPKRPHQCLAGSNSGAGDDRGREGCRGVHTSPKEGRAGCLCPTW